MKIIFLDVDGVLNFDGSKEKVCVDKVKLLKKIVDRTGAKIVLSSDWRYWWGKRDEDLSNLIQKLKECGMGMLSRTPVTKHCYRGAEIYQWLNEWQGEKISSFVIFDDQDDMKPFMDKLVRTSCKIGLTDDDVERAIKILGVAQA